MSRVRFPMKQGIEIRQFTLRLSKVWQVWFDGAGASGYFRTKAEAEEEAKFIETEVRLGGVKHDRQPAQFRFTPDTNSKERWTSKPPPWAAMKRRKGNDVYDEGPEDL